MKRLIFGMLIALTAVAISGLGQGVMAGDKDQATVEKTSAKTGDKTRGDTTGSGWDWTWVADLSAKNETWQDTTRGTGKAMFKVTDDGKGLAYKLVVDDMDSVFAAHIHLGKKGENGPPVLFLYKGKTTGEFTGTLSDSTATAADLFGPMKGKSMSDLIDKIKNGDAYVQVHTNMYQEGAIRGHIMMVNKEEWGKKKESGGSGY
jgi:hypothetical protein